MAYILKAGFFTGKKWHKMFGFGTTDIASVGCRMRCLAQVLHKNQSHDRLPAASLSAARLTSATRLFISHSHSHTSDRTCCQPQEWLPAIPVTGLAFSHRNDYQPQVWLLAVGLSALGLSATGLTVSQTTTSCWTEYWQQDWLIATGLSSAGLSADGLTIICRTISQWTDYQGAGLTIYHRIREQPMDWLPGAGWLSAVGLGNIQ